MVDCILMLRHDHGYFFIFFKNHHVSYINWRCTSTINANLKLFYRCKCYFVATNAVIYSYKSCFVAINGIFSYKCCCLAVHAILELCLESYSMIYIHRYTIHVHNMYTQTCIHVHIYINTCIHTYIHTCTHAYIHIIYIYIYIYMYTHKSVQLHKP
jgi:hypothetical protein